jgi:hypothetical protein
MEQAVQEAECSGVLGQEPEVCPRTTQVRDSCAVLSAKSAYVTGAAAIVVAGVLGFLAGGRPGILAAFAGLIPPTLWQIMRDRRTKAKVQREQLGNAVELDALRKFVYGQIWNGKVSNGDLDNLISDRVSGKICPVDC